MALGAFVFLLLPLLSQADVAWVQSALYRHHNSLVSYTNFTCDLNHQLAVTKIASYLVEDNFDCTFKCIGKQNCLSFNLAVNPDSEGFYLCDLLATDKYRSSSNDLQPSADFHHCSPWVSNAVTCFLSYFILLCFLFQWSLDPFRLRSYPWASFVLREN